MKTNRAAMPILGLIIVAGIACGGAEAQAISGPGPVANGYVLTGATVQPRGCVRYAVGMAGVSLGDRLRVVVLGGSPDGLKVAAEPVAPGAIQWAVCNGASRPVVAPALTVFAHVAE